MHFDILNGLGGYNECDRQPGAERQTDRQTEPPLARQNEHHSNSKKQYFKTISFKFGMHLTFWDLGISSQPLKFP